jgi:predicted HicB family RNase H-like nuclease
MTRKQIREQAARYVKYVEWSDEDRCFIGRCPEIFSGAVHGSDEARVYTELCETVEEWIEVLGNDRIPFPDPMSGQKEFSGKFVFRLEPALHRRLAAKASAAGELKQLLREGPRESVNSPSEQIGIFRVALDE